MKKTLLVAAALVAMTGSAMALDVGIVAGSSFAGGDRSFAGITVGKKLDDKFGVIVGLERTNEKLGQFSGQNRYSVTGTYDVVKIGATTLVGKAGFAYLNNQIADGGLAATVGVGAVYALTPRVNATLDYRHQFGQSRVEQFNGNSMFAGLTYAF